MDPFPEGFLWLRISHFSIINPLNLQHKCRFQFQKKYQHAEGIWESSKLLVDWKDWFVKKLQQSGDIAISMYMV